MKIRTTAMLASLLMVLGVTLPGVSWSAEPIKVSRQMKYRDDGMISDELKASCDWGRIFTDTLTKSARGLVQVTDEDVASMRGRRLETVVTNMHVVGGGGFTGPKWIYIRATVKDGDQVADEFDVDSRSNGGAGRLTTCSTLQYLAKTLGKRTAVRLLKRPSIEEP